MKNKLKKLLTFLFVAIMALTFVACDIEISTNDEPGEIGKSTDDENDVTISIDVAEQMNDKWKMTYKECQIKNKLDSFTTAEEGTEFVLVFFEIENISDESQTFSIFYEEFYIDGFKTAQTLYGVSINNSFPLTGVPIEPGRKANGYFLFQTSPDWKELEIIYDESLTNENKENVLRFTLTKNAEHCDMDTGNVEKPNETEKSTEENSIIFSIDTTEQKNDTWKMTYKECQIKNKLDSFTTAEEGTEFVLVFFEIENISDESQTFSIFYEEFYIDGFKTAQTLYGVSINNSFPLTTVPVEPGRKAKGYFLFQTSPDWKELEIIYDESLTNENEENVMKFTLTKNAE